MTEYKFNININIINKKLENCNDCIKNLDDIIISINKEKVSKDYYANKFLSVRKYAKLNKNLILDKEVLNKLQS